MPLQLIYAISPKLYFLVNEGFDILQVQAKGRSKINPAAIIVHAISVTSGKPGIRDNVFHMDGWGLVEFAGWLYSTNPRMPVRTFGAKLFCMLERCAHLPEVARAVYRIAFHRRSEAFGEEAYFYNDQLRQHPERWRAVRGDAQ